MNRVGSGQVETSGLTDPQIANHVRAFETLQTRDAAMRAYGSSSTMAPRTR